MSEKKSGCSVIVKITCKDENGKIISTYPKGGQYGYDRETANAVAKAYADAINSVIAGFIEAQKAAPPKK